MVLVKESAIEKRLRLGVARLGGIAYKFVSPGRRGVQDRLCVFPGGMVVFIETKAPNGSLSPSQTRETARLLDLGARVKTLYTIELVDAFLKEIDQALWLWRKKYRRA